MASNIAIKVVADVTDIQVKFAIAKAESSALTSEFNKLARQASVTGGALSSEMQAQLQQAATAALGAQQKTAGLRQELASFGAEAGHGGISTATREFRALFDELSSGRTRMTPGTLAIIATRVFGIGGAALGATAGVGALAAGLGYLAYSAVSSASALDLVKLAADFAGNINLSRDEIESLTASMSELPGVSKSAAEKIVESFATMRDAGAQEISALSLAVSSYAQATGQSADKAAESLKKSFSDPLKNVDEFLNSLQGVTQQEYDAADAAVRSGNAHAASAVMLEALRNALAKVQPEIQQHNASIFASISNYLGMWAALRSGEDPMKVQADLLQQQTDHWNALAKAITAAVGVEQHRTPTPTETIQTGLSAAKDVNPNAKALDEAKLKITQITSALAAAKNIGDEVDVAKLNQGLTEAKKRLTELQQRDNGPANKAAEKARQTADAVTQIQQTAQTAHIQSERRTNDFLLQMGEESLDAWKSQADRLEDARYEAEESFYARKAKLDTGNQKAEAEDNAHLVALAQQHSDALLAIDQDYQQRQRQIEQTSTQQFIQDASEKLEKGVSADDAAYSAGAITAQKRHDLEIALTQSVQTEVLKRLDAEIAGLTKGTEAYAQAVKQREKLAAQFGTDVQKINQTLDTENAALWKETTQGMVRSFGGAIGDMIQHGGTFGSFMAAIADGVESALLDAGEKILENWIETNLLSQTSSQTSSAGQIAANAAVAGSAAVASTAAIPIIGPDLAPAAGVAAYTEAMSYEAVSLAVGTNFVPQDMLANIHHGEMVVPAFESTMFRRAVANLPSVGQGGASQSPGAPGGGSQVHAHFHIHAIDTQSGADFLKKNMRQFADQFRDHVATRGPNFRRALQTGQPQK